MNVALLGYGRMGHAVEAAATARGHEVHVKLDVDDNADGAGIDAARFAAVDVAVDFTQPSAVLDNVEATMRVGVPLVIGTTGWDDRAGEVRSIVEEHDGALVHAANFSIGANLFLRIIERAAALFDRFDDYDPYVFEHHHRNKIDAPSGTALRLAQAVIDGIDRKTHVQGGNPDGAIEPDGLHVASLRAGKAFGEHRVGFDGETDVIELVHLARGRDGFAHGAVLAAEWIAGRRGFFSFDQVLDNILSGDDTGGPD